jgi:hypothetical protein
MQTSLSPSGFINKAMATKFWINDVTRVMEEITLFY